MTDLPLSRSSAWRLERCLFFLLVVIVFAYLAVRAFVVPFTQDEGSSFWLYVHSGEFFPFRSHLDAGNHFLNSLFGNIGYMLAGPGMGVIRWGSLLSYAVYAWGVWRLTRELSSGMVRWCAILALLLSPYLLDYFSMFRGYGPAMAGWVWALHGLVRFISSGTRRSLMMMAWGMFFAVYADLAILPMWPLFLCLTSWVYLRGRQVQENRIRGRTFIAITAVQLAGTAFAACMALALRHAGLLYHGSGEGFYAVTVDTLVGAVFWDPGDRLLMTVSALILLALAVAAGYVWRTRCWRSPLVIMAVVLCGELVAREAMYHGLGVNFPEGRTALHLIPLCIGLYSFAADALTRTGSAWAVLAMALLALPVQVLRTLNFGRAVNNESAATPLRFIDRVQRLQEELGRPVMLSGYGQLNGCWAYHQFARGSAPIPMRPDPLAGEPDDARVICTWQLSEYRDGYVVADSGEVSGVVLLFRDRPPALEAFADTNCADGDWSQEFVDLHLPATTVGEEAFLRFTGRFATSDPRWDVRLVTEVRDAQGGSVRYDAVPLQQWRLKDGECMVDVLRWIPASPGGKRLVYLHNPGRATFRMSGGRTRLYRERPTLAD